jgi:hypothetical protein
MISLPSSSSPTLYKCSINVKRFYILSGSRISDNGSADFETNARHLLFRFSSNTAVPEKLPNWQALCEG